jgi:hypothetical protein
MEPEGSLPCSQEPNEQIQSKNIDHNNAYIREVVPVPRAPPEHHAMRAYWGSGGTAPPIL